MLFSKKQKFSDVYFICDLGSSSVGGSLVFVTEDQQVHILWQVRKNINFSSKEHRLNIDILKKTIKNIVTMADEFMFENKYRQKIRRAVISVSSPWYTTQFKTINKTKGSPFNFFKEDFSKLVEESKDSLREELLAEKNYRSEFFEDGAQIVEQAIIDLKINGYQVKEFIDTKARHIQVTLMLSIIPKIVFEYLEAVLDNVWSNVEIEMSTFPFIHYNALRYLRHTKEDQVLIDISGYETEFSYIRNAVLSRMSYVDIGKNHFVDTIAKASKIETYIAESEFRLFTQMQSNDQHMSSTHFILESIESLWKERVSTLLTSKEILGKKYILSVDQEYYDYFHRILAEVLRDINPDSDIGIQKASYDTKMITYSNNLKSDYYLEIVMLALFHRIGLRA